MAQDREQDARAEADGFFRGFEASSEDPSVCVRLSRKPIFVGYVDRYHIFECGSGEESMWGEAEADLEVRAECEECGEPTAIHRNAWGHFVANAKKYETMLREYLWRKAKKNYQWGCESDQMSPTEHWRELTAKADFSAPSSLELQVALEGIGLLERGRRSVGFICFDFRVGWDPEHGMSVLMHEGQILASDGCREFYRRGSQIEADIEYLQSLESVEE